MMKHVSFFILLLAIHTGYAQQPIHFTDFEYPVLSAHRGGHAPGRVENSLKSCQYTLQHIPGAWLEVDVSSSKDSVLFLHHDFDLDRTTTGSGDPADHNWAELAQLRLIDINGDTLDQGLIRFDDFLQWAKGKTALAIDEKPSAKPAAIAKAIAKADMSHDVYIITRGLDNALAWHRANPDLVLQVYCNEVNDDSTDFQAHIDAGIPANKLAACIRNYARSDSAWIHLVHRLKARNISITLLPLTGLDDVATQEGYQVYIPYMQDGVDIFATDVPELVQKAVREFKE